MRRFRSIFISDVHIGTNGVEIGKLLDFLRDSDCDYIYIVGDLFDGWELQKKWKWRHEYNVFIQKILRKARKGVKIFYITGNHDEFANHFVGNNLGNIQIVEEIVHETADERKLLVIHGHQFDGLLSCAKWLQVIGSHLYQYLINLNCLNNKIRRFFGLQSSWSLSYFIKTNVKEAVNYINNFEEIACQSVKSRNLDGIVCGHIHSEKIKQIDGVHYYNCGCFVEKATCLVEHDDATFEIINL